MQYGFCFLFPAAALLGQEIFVAGGQAEQEVINSAEVYNPELNQWEHMVARMLTPRVGLALVSMGNLIYAIGERWMCVLEGFHRMHNFSSKNNRSLYCSTFETAAAK